MMNHSITVAHKRLIAIRQLRGLVIAALRNAPPIIAYRAIRVVDMMLMKDIGLAYLRARLLEPGVPLA